MSESNVMELFGKNGVAKNAREGGELSATNGSATSDASGQRAPDATAEMDEEILDALRSARKGLTDGGIAAVIALRHAIGVHTALEELLLEGSIDAVMENDNGPLLVSNFRFFAVTSEDEPADEMPPDMGR